MPAAKNQKENEKRMTKKHENRNVDRRALKLMSSLLFVMHVNRAMYDCVYATLTMIYGMVATLLEELAVSMGLP